MARQLTLLQINDVHAYLELHPEVFWEGGQRTYRRAGGYARLARLMKEARAERPDGVLLLDSGDTLHGTYPAVSSQGGALVPVLNRLGIAAMTAHWEFAYGPAVLQQRCAELAYPLLASNVYNESDGARPFDPYRVFEAGGLRVGVIGLASNIVDKTMPPHFSRGLSFTSGREELPEAVDKLRRAERADLVVVLSHLGFPQDMALLAETRGVDVCLSGHTHNRLYAPARQGDCVVIQSGSHGALLGRLDLTVEAGRVTDCRHRLIEASEAVEPDPEMDELAARAARPDDLDLTEVVGEALTPFDRATSLEATLDNLLLAALRETMEAPLAFSNGWRYGAPIVPGPITLNDLHNIIPVNPKIGTTVLTGREIRAMLEENLDRTFARDPFGQMGGYLKRCLGLAATVRIENPYPERIQELFVEGRAVEPDRQYRAAFVTEQGVPAKYGAERAEHEVRAVEALRRYLKRHGPVSAEWHGTFQLV